MSDNRELLVRHFGEAGLKLKVVDKPFGGVTTTEIFQLDIRRRDRRNARSEYFIMYPGNEQNTVQVLAKDKNHRANIPVDCSFTPISFLK